METIPVDTQALQTLNLILSIVRLQCGDDLEPLANTIIHTLKVGQDYQLQWYFRSRIIRCFEKGCMALYGERDSFWDKHLLACQYFAFQLLFSKFLPRYVVDLTDDWGKRFLLTMLICGRRHHFLRSLLFLLFAEEDVPIRK